MRVYRFIFAMSWLFLACGGGGGAPASDPNAMVEQFKGVSLMEKTNDNAWLIKWTPIATDGILYAVYKAKEGESFDFDSPLVTTELDFYKFKPKNIFQESHQCFLVRVVNYGNDTNEETECTSDEILAFAGAQSIEQQNDGTYLIEWNQIPVEGVVFSIYERKSDADYDFSQPSYDAVKDNFLKTSMFQRGEQYCFAVRYSHVDLPQDENTNEVCSLDEPPIDFPGISQLVSLSSSEVKVIWVSLSDPNVVAYNTYQGSDFKELFSGAEAGESEVVIEGLVPGRQYSFGVKAVDQFGREDANLRILSIVMPAAN